MPSGPSAQPQPSGNGGGAAAANAIQAALAANIGNAAKPRVPIVVGQSQSAPNSARGVNHDAAHHHAQPPSQPSQAPVSAIAASVAPAVQAQADMLRRQREREEELRRKRDEEAKRVAELEAWEAEKRRKLKEERDRVQKMKQLADELGIARVVTMDEETLIDPEGVQVDSDGEDELEEQMEKLTKAILQGKKSMRVDCGMDQSVHSALDKLALAPKKREWLLKYATNQIVSEGGGDLADVSTLDWEEDEAFGEKPEEMFPQGYDQVRCSALVFWFYLFVCYLIFSFPIPLSICFSLSVLFLS